MELQEVKGTIEKKLMDKLFEWGLLSTDQIAEACAKTAEKGIPLTQYLITHGLVNKTKAYEAQAEVYGVPYADVSSFQISQEALNCIPGELAFRYRAIPLFKTGNALNVAMENPCDVTAIDHLILKCHCDIETCLGAPDDIEAALHAHYGSIDSFTEILDDMKKEAGPFEETDDYEVVLDTSPEKTPEVSAFHPPKRPVIELVNRILRRAYEERASDIHVEPDDKILRIRYRIDGVLYSAMTFPKHVESELVTRIKVLAQMNIAESRLPQDGRIKMRIGKKEINMRVASSPTIYGENLVLRILREEPATLDLGVLGLNREMRETFEVLIRRPYGMILETGPTGSGKTTTLYAALSLINSVERNIVTIEDPVEYKLSLLRQIPVNYKAGLTFANALRSILRQDPDVLMVGEIRDVETAEIAIQAALTGHLVFSTLHANNAVGALTRLVDMGIRPFLVASSVIGVVSQRLVRLICSKCKKEVSPPPALLEALKISHRKIRAFQGAGCSHCHDKGYLGRIGIFEILKVNEALQKKIVANASSAEIEQEARKAGFKDMLEDALEKVEGGLTTIEEVYKAVAPE